jgi:malonyl-CoA O-methyltransferase
VQLSSAGQRDQDSAFELDRHAVRHGFARATAHPEAFASSLQRLNTELLERLQYFALRPEYILDLGAGTGSASLKLRERYRGAQVIAVDFALPRLIKTPSSWWPRGRFHRVAADATLLPLANRSIDLVYSNLLLPFCDRPDEVFREVARVLKEGGLFVFSSLGPDTLKELRAAWAQADDGAHVNQFPNLPALGDALMHSGLIEPVMDTEQHPLHFPDVRSLLRELKGSGTRNAIRSRAGALTGGGRLLRMIESYESRRGSDGIPATFEVIFGAAFATGSRADPVAAGGGDVAIPVASIRKHIR